MASIIKVDNVQNTAAGKNIIKEVGNTVTIGASGDTVALASGASQTGFGQTYSAVAWDTTAKTTTVTGVAGVGYFINTTGGAVTANLPAGVVGDVIAFADYSATWQTNNVTVTPNGSDKIGALNLNAVLNTQGQSVTFVFVDSTQGWLNTMDSTSNVRGNPNFAATGGTITTVCTDYKVHTFTGPGTFTVSQLSTTPANNVISYSVVAGGGGANSSGGGGGGAGAGGFREGKSPVTPYTASPLNAPIGLTISSSGAIPVTIGAGSATVSGSNSVFSTITSAGGGQGATEGSKAGGSGGSGGGGGYSPGGSAGSGNTPPVSPAQGFPGGGDGGGAAGYGGSGGGGASAVGTAGTPSSGGNGGNGVATSITGSSVTRAGGGAGASRCSAGSAGSGGGGAGGAGSPAAGGNGTVNTGGGAGGGADTCGGAGGSGLVIIRYKFQ